MKQLVIIAAVVLWSVSCQPMVGERSSAQNDYRTAKLNYARHLTETLEINDRSFQIVQNSGANYPVGTLLTKGGVPFNECEPDLSKLKEVDMALLPPSQDKRTFKFDVSLPALFLKKILELKIFGFKGDDSELIELSFSNPKQRLLYEDDLTTLLESDACRKAIAGRGFIFIRGQILARQKFSWDKTSSAELTVMAEDNSNLLVGRRNGSPVYLEDSNSFAHFFVVKVVEPDNAFLNFRIDDEQRALLVRALQASQSREKLTRLSQDVAAQLENAFLSVETTADLASSVSELVSNNPSFSVDAQNAVAAVVDVAGASPALNASMRYDIALALTRNEVSITPQIESALPLMAAAGAVGLSGTYGANSYIDWRAGGIVRRRQPSPEFYQSVPSDMERERGRIIKEDKRWYIEIKGNNESTIRFRPGYLTEDQVELIFLK